MKVIGALLIIAGSSCFGFSLAVSHKADIKALRQLILILEYMKSELQYRLTPLPQLCRQAAGESSGVMRELFTKLWKELENQIAPDVNVCMNAAIAQCGGLPMYTGECVNMLGQTLGRFDLQGQISGLDSVRQACHVKLEALEADKEARLRSYQTLCLCTGAALAILLL